MLRYSLCRRAAGPAFALALLTAVSACDFTVTNPGPIADEFLDDPAAIPGMVNGAGRGLSDGLNWIALTGGAVTHEVIGSGNLVSVGVSLVQRQGKLVPSDLDQQWARSQRARWTAENTIARMRTSLGADFAKSATAAQGLVHAGYINRLLGENMCEAVFDGGPRESRMKYFERAEAHFTEAIAVATAAAQPALANAATAGRASVRMWRDNWVGAVADASAIPKGFRYDAKMTINTLDEYNRIAWAVWSQPARTISVYTTFYETYYTETKDPRTPWDRMPGFPYGDSGNPPTPFYRQLKYTLREAGIPLSKWTEMQLILAEARLKASDLPGGLALINTVRAQAGMAPRAASTLAEGWAHLKRERGIELWLEGRRLGDFWRWRATSTPGVNPDDTGQDGCMPIATSELNSNPNLQ